MREVSRVRYHGFAGGRVGRAGREESPNRQMEVRGRGSDRGGEKECVSVIRILKDWQDGRLHESCSAT